MAEWNARLAAREQKTAWVPNREPVSGREGVMLEQKASSSLTGKEKKKSKQKEVSRDRVQAGCPGKLGCRE